MSRKYKVEADFIHNGLRCVVIASIQGHRCGYVMVQKDHPLYGKDSTDYSGISLDEYEDLTVECMVDVHGGLTYSEGNEGYPVDHDNSWCFGFDCAHAGDAKDISIMDEEYKKFEKEHNYRCVEDVVRTTEYVIDECNRLADQLVSIKKAVSK